jgi:hypothetical protein
MLWSRFPVLDVLRPDREGHLRKDCREMLHDSLENRITSRAGEVAVVVDGIALDLEDLARFLAARAGWGFEMRITGSLD